MEIVYSQATRDDIPDLERVRLNYLFADHPDMTFEEADKVRETLPSYFEKHVGVDLHPFIARDMMYRGELIASAFLLVIEKPANPNFIHGKVGEVLNVFTAKQYRNNGISTTLIKMVIDKAQELGLDYIKLSSTDMGYDMYKKVGFEDSNSSYHEMIYKL